MQDQREEFQHDWYGILGCDVGTSIEDLQKSARKLALKYHPDKTTDPDAPAKFLLIQKAKEILTDEAKKKTIDDHFAAAKKRAEYENERNKGMDERRKRFRDALEKNVDIALKRPKDPNEVLAQEVKKSSKITESIRRQNQAFMQEAADELRRSMDQKAADFESYAKTIAKEYGLKNCQIKVKWKRSITNDEQSLHCMLSTFGAIEDIAISESKGTSAVVTFCSPAAARKAIDHFATSVDYRISFVADQQKESSRPQVFSHHYPSSSKSSTLAGEEFGSQNPHSDSSSFLNRNYKLLERISKEEFGQKEKDTLDLLRKAAEASCEAQ